MPKFKINGWIDGRTIPKMRESMRVILMRWMWLSRLLHAGVAGLTDIDSMLSFDAHYSIDLMESALKITGSVLNLTDEKAPLAPHEQGHATPTTPWVAYSRLDCVIPLGMLDVGAVV